MTHKENCSMTCKNSGENKMGHSCSKCELCVCVLTDMTHNPNCLKNDPFMGHHMACTCPEANITWRPETGEVKFHTEPKEEKTCCKKCHFTLKKRKFVRTPCTYCPCHKEKNCPDCQFEEGHSPECPKYVE